MGEIEKLMESTGASSIYRIVNLGGNSLYIEGIKAVLGFAENEMQFQLKKQILTVGGVELKVKYLDKSTCIITGQIQSVVAKWNMT